MYQHFNWFIVNKKIKKLTLKIKLNIYTYDTCIKVFTGELTNQSRDWTNIYDEEREIIEVVSVCMQILYADSQTCICKVDISFPCKTVEYIPIKSCE